MARFTLDEPIYIIKNNEIHETTARTFNLRPDTTTPIGIEDRWAIVEKEDQIFIEYRSQFGFDHYRYLEFPSLEKAQKQIDEWDAEYFFQHADNHGIDWYRDRKEAEYWLEEMLLSDNN